MTGGTVEGYRGVLALFLADAEERLGLLRETPGQETLPRFVTQVHALKSAAGSIGAAELFEEAARLEAAGRNGEAALFAKALPGFVKRLEDLIAAAGGALASGGGAERAGGPDGGPGRLLAELDAMLEARYIEAVDRLLEALAGRPLDAAARRDLEEIADQVLLADFNGARETLKGLIGKGAAGNGAAANEQAGG
jgi:HPt (histidine-containing phosphotransfer) domain-containing protein